MSQDPKLTAERRTKLGTAECRRLRRRSLVPGNIYGHGAEPVMISVPEDALRPVVFSGHKVVDLDFGSGSEKAILRGVQWDTFGIDLLHFDLQRIDADERVTTEIAVEMHGAAPGVVAGGVLEIPHHTLRIECRATQIPDRLVVNINHLERGASIHVRDLELPEGVTVLNGADEVVVHVVDPAAVEEPEDAAGGIEPEVVGEAEDEAGDA